MKFPVFDLHCDTANELIGLGGADCSELRDNKVHIDLKRAGELGGYTQCFACFTTYSKTVDPVVVFEKKLAALMREFDRNCDVIRQAYSAADIEKNTNAGLMSAILTIEGPAGFGFDPALLEDLYKVGFRMSTLGWNEKNPLTGSHVTGGGLTDLGRVYVEEAQRLGMVVDVSHISDEGFWDIMDITNAPIVASHSNSRKVWGASRNLTDEMFLEICKTGGATGINLFADFLGDTPSIDTVCDHIFHFLELDPGGKHIALGGDLDGCERLPLEFSGIQDYSLISKRLIERGLDQSVVTDIFWNNAMRVIKQCCM